MADQAWLHTLCVFMGSPIMSNKDLDTLKHRLREFADTRDWNQFHSPKNLCMALGVEVAEIAEHFQWLTDIDLLAAAFSKIELNKQKYPVEKSRGNAKKYTEFSG